MTSLALLAHPASHAAPAFNGLFYATVATVIPVLFLALAVQGSTYRELVKSSQAGHLLAKWAAAGILLYGTMGEIWALLSLSAQRARGASGFVLLSVIFLVLATAAGPFVAYVRAERAEALAARERTRTLRQPSARASSGEPDATDPGTPPGEPSPS
jgi:hypothetical protein